MSGLSIQDRTYLRKFLRDRFTLDELEDLAFDIGVDYEDFPHATKPDFVRGLIDYLENRKNVRPLVEYVIENRPDDNLVEILARLPMQNGLQKVQIILSNSKIQSKPDLKQKLAALLDISVADVNLIATAVGSVKLLVSLPPEAAERLKRLDLPHQLENYEIIEVDGFNVLPNPIQRTWRQIYSAKSAVKWIAIGTVVTSGITIGKILLWIMASVTGLILLIGVGAAIWYQGRPDMMITNQCDTTLPIPIPESARDFLNLPKEFGHGDSISFPVLSGAGTYELITQGQPPQVVLKLPRPLPFVNLDEIELGPEDKTEEFWLNGKRVDIPSRFEIGRNEQIELSLCGK